MRTSKRVTKIIKQVKWSKGLRWQIEYSEQILLHYVR